MKSYKADLVDQAVWEWIKHIVPHPENIAEGLRAQQSELNKQSTILRKRLELITQKLSDTEIQLAKVLDLYLSGYFPRNVWTQRKTDLEKSHSEFRLKVTH